MANVENYLRIFRWRGLSGELLLHGTPDPRETAIALIQLASLARKPSTLVDALPRPLYRVLTEEVSDAGHMTATMHDPIKRALFLSDLHDFLQIYQRYHAEHREHA